ncbi:response regulator [Patescibacteria group bacterium]|nr:response regulator [Patescibacteria group bacterium]MBU2158578.1 response regulator [Patescibacteria group bacterium]MBU2220764.1 response regulator [Patescibacteria group bacterium]
MATPYRIYLVDDDRFLLDMYAVKFRAAGHEVTAFAGGEDVLAALRESPAPDAVLLDIVMPGIDGFQILEAVKKEQLAKTAKFIVLSNQGQESDTTRAKELGAAGYIIKASAIPSEVFSETIAIIEKPV